MWRYALARGRGVDHEGAHDASDRRHSDRVVQEDLLVVREELLGLDLHRRYVELEIAHWRLDIERMCVRVCGALG